jgi:hypothetical protein
MITEPTHIEGNVLDQAYLRDINGELECTAELHSKYYTDHKGHAIIVKKKGMMTLLLNILLHSYTFRKLDEETSYSC